MHRRNRSARAAERWTDRLRRDLQSRHPAVAWLGFVPHTSTVVLRIEGQETLVPLGRLQRRAEVFPEAFERLVDQLLDEAREFGSERVSQLRFERVAGDLFPQVRSLDWLQAGAGRFGDQGLVATPLFADLVVVVAIDREDRLTFVPRGLARQWDRQPAELVGLAVRNLRRRLGVESLPVAEESGVVLDRGDGFDAACACLLDAPRREGLCIAVPDRDLLWYGRPSEDAVHELARAAVALHAAANHPVSPALYRVRGGRVESVTTAVG